MHIIFSLFPILQPFLSSLETCTQSFVSLPNRPRLLISVEIRIRRMRVRVERCVNRAEAEVAANRYPDDRARCMWVQLHIGGGAIIQV